jgi:hypothetical protein
VSAMLHLPIVVSTDSNAAPGPNAPAVWGAPAPMETGPVSDTNAANPSAGAPVRLSQQHFL